MFTLALTLSFANPALAQDPGTLVVDVQKDTRRCAWPMCGGWWVHTVNRPSMTCADGTSRSWCYVLEIDTAPLGLPPDAELALRNAMTDRTALLQVTGRTVVIDGYPYATLTASRAWNEVR